MNDIEKFSENLALQPGQNPTLVADIKYLQSQNLLEFFGPKPDPQPQNPTIAQTPTNPVTINPNPPPKNGRFSPPKDPPGLTQQAHRFFFPETHPNPSQNPPTPPPAPPLQQTMPGHTASKLNIKGPPTPKYHFPRGNHFWHQGDLDLAKTPSNPDQSAENGKSKIQKFFDKIQKKTSNELKEHTIEKDKEKHLLSRLYEKEIAGDH